jgi:hypothetical protein
VEGTIGGGRQVMPRGLQPALIINNVHCQLTLEELIERNGSIAIYLSWYAAYCGMLLASPPALLLFRLHKIAKHRSGGRAIPAPYSRCRRLVRCCSTESWYLLRYWHLLHCRVLLLVSCLLLSLPLLLWR